MALPKIYDWERIRKALKQLAEAFPDGFQDWILVGGGACWFYRVVLERADDHMFRVPDLTPEEEATWLSKDIDFMGLSPEAAELLLRASRNEETHTIAFAGLEVDFVESGLRITPETVNRNYREVRTPEFVFQVVDAALLYAEKISLLQAKARAQDRLHARLLAEYLKYEFCFEAEHAADLDASDWVQRARIVKIADYEFFVRDARAPQRLARAVARLQAPEHKAVVHWARHHLPHDAAS